MSGSDFSWIVLLRWELPFFSREAGYAADAENVMRAAGGANASHGQGVLEIDSYENHNLINHFNSN
ncbi:MAG TPA: hypothetical protein VNT00_00350 [Eoetvoesiella sp.]|uniref:hypothetical protein n=1 Tax=Eoetvoesiella sp. TaxID=1966355 RepID=UPI002B9CFB89|nr:hypothetical protein [Eoetvoesiella sp.]HWK59841.1 hypothetical protein [Eoetvoesiella sp.]